jgi:hypothetical protein
MKVFKGMIHLREQVFSRRLIVSGRDRLKADS